MSHDHRAMMAFERSEAERQQLLAWLDHLEIRERSTSPGDGAWSVAQAVMHLAVAEEGALAYLRKKLHSGGHRRASFVGGLRLLALRTAFTLPVRWRAPRIIAHIPTVEWHEAISQWDRVRKEWREILEQLPPDLATHDLFKHPVAGKLTLVQGIHFMASHARHHRKQMERTIRRLRG